MYELFSLVMCKYQNIYFTDKKEMFIKAFRYNNSERKKIFGAFT